MVRQFMIPLLKEQQARGHTVSACCSADAHVQTIQDQGITVHALEWPRSLNPFTLLKLISHIRRLIVREHIEAIVCHSPIGAGAGRIAGRRAKCSNIIYCAHGLPCAPGQRAPTWWFWFLLEKLLARCCTDRLLVMNQYDYALGTSRLMADPSQVVRIPGMGIDTQRFEPAAGHTARREMLQTLEWPQDGRMVLSVAHLIVQKGIYLFFQAAQKVCVRHPEVVFVIAGDGPHRSALETASYATGMADRFRVLGWVDDMARLMQAADCFVLPTYYYEGLPVSILEAMACAKPVIATRHRGCEDIVVHGETGLLVPIRRVGPLVEAVLSVLDDPALARSMGEKGRQRVLDHFELNRCTAALANAIDEVWETE